MGASQIRNWEWLRGWRMGCGKSIPSGDPQSKSTAPVAAAHVTPLPDATKASDSGGIEDAKADGKVTDTVTNHLANNTGGGTGANKNAGVINDTDAMNRQANDTGEKTGAEETGAIKDAGVVDDTDGGDKSVDASAASGKDKGKKGGKKVSMLPKRKGTFVKIESKDKKIGTFKATEATEATQPTQTTAATEATEATEAAEATVASVGAAAQDKRKKTMKLGKRQGTFEKISHTECLIMPASPVAQQQSRNGGAVTP